MARASQVEEYWETHPGVCGTDELIKLVDYRHMSDEESGPDEASDESYAQWTDRLMTEGQLTAEQLGTMKLLEVIEPAWRSEEVSTNLLPFSW